MKFGNHSRQFKKVQHLQNVLGFQKYFSISKLFLTFEKVHKRKKKGENKNRKPIIKSANWWRKKLTKMFRNLHKTGRRGQEWDIMYTCIWSTPAFLGKLLGTIEVGFGTFHLILWRFRPFLLYFFKRVFYLFACFLFQFSLFFSFLFYFYFLLNFCLLFINIFKYMLPFL